MNTEHNGAKNGGGHWGPRKEAKSMSNKARRGDDKRATLRSIIRTSDRVRFVPFIGSPATMPRGEALAYLADDLRSYDEARALGALVPGDVYPHLEEVRRSR